MESKVDDTLSDSRGSFLKTSVKPFCLENTRMMIADSLISERVICSGMVRPDLFERISSRMYLDLGSCSYAAAKGWGEANEGLVER